MGKGYSIISVWLKNTLRQPQHFSKIFSGLSNNKIPEILYIKQKVNTSAIKKKTLIATNYTNSFYELRLKKIATFIYLKCSVSLSCLHVGKNKLKNLIFIVLSEKRIIFWLSRCFCVSPINFPGSMNWIF